MKEQIYKKISSFFIIVLITLVLFVFYSNIYIKAYELNSININEKQLSLNNELINNKYQGLILNANLTPNDSGEEAFINTVNLQNYINYVSESGGGVVHIPEGTYYFRVDPNNRDLNWVKTGNGCHYIIWCKDNVLIEGEGIDKTILKPYGTYPYGLNMFHYTTLFNENSTGITPEFVKNADFRNFTIDCSEETYGSDAPSYDRSTAYHAMGKGFMMAPIKNCDWENVQVLNTDGTGFGVDLPVNCTISNCIAIGCGKEATEKDAGASGFGIGTGYTDDESMVIKNCISINNKKYGYFFENQTRFNKFKNQPSQATTSEGFVVINCKASGNLYDFGGARANDVIYENCISEGTPVSKSISYELHSFRTYADGIKIEKQFDDVDISSKDYDSICWAYNKGITNGITSKDFYFKGNAEATRGQAILFLFRYAGMPGKIVTYPDSTVNQNLTSRYYDVTPNSIYFDAIKWAENEKIVDSEGVTNFNTNEFCTKASFITMLWRYAGRPLVDDTNNFEDVDSNKWYNPAIDWGIEKGIISIPISKDRKYYFKPNDAITRTEIVTYLYRYNNSLNTTFNINYYLLGGVIQNVNPSSYISGKDNFSLNNPTKAGYLFDGWTGSIEKDFNPNTYIPQTNISITENDTGNKVFTANWTPINYYISFDSNTGTGTMENQIFTYDMPQLLVTNKFNKQGYIFKEWNTKPDGTGTTYANNQVINNITSNNDEIITLYAIWEKEINEISYYTIDNNIISDINPNTTISDFKKHINLNTYIYLKIYDRNEFEITDESYLISTGMTIKLFLANKSAKLNIIVTGDIDGNGIIDVHDLLLVNQHRLNNNNLEGIYYEAADINKDNSVDIKDLLQLNKSRLGNLDF